MAEDRRAYAVTYAAMTDEEILALLQEPGTLTNEAQLAIKEEAIRRGLDANALAGSPAVSTRQSAQVIIRPAGGLIDHWIASASTGVGYGDDTAAPNVARLQFSIRNPDLPLPLGGWLIALIIYMLLVPTLECTQIALERMKYANIADVSGALTLAWVLVKVPSLLFMMFAGVALMIRLRRCVEIAKVSLTIEAIVAFVFTVAFALYRAFFVELAAKSPSSVFAQPGQLPFSTYVLVEVHFLQSVVNGLCFALASLLGVFYLQKSRRVRLTYPGA